MDVPSKMQMGAVVIIPVKTSPKKSFPPQSVFMRKKWGKILFFPPHPHFLKQVLQFFEKSCDTF